jgi:predicted Zn finger-like uncharacterized protein
MQIVCPNCATSYQVSAASLEPAGRTVRCVRCKTVWFATAAEEPAIEITEPPAPDPAGGEEMPPPAPPQTAAEDSAAIDEISFPSGAEMLPEPSIPQDLDAFASGQLPGQDGGLDLPSTGEPDDLGLRRARLKALSSAARMRRPSMSTVILSLMAVIAVLLGWRTDVVRLMPQTASLFAAIGLPVNLRGLDFQSVIMAKETHEGVPVLVLDGRITNVSKQMLEVPRIRFGMRNAAGTEIYSWTALPARSILAPGDAMPFNTRLASPPSEGKDVIIRFFNRRDAVAGIR